MECYFTNHKSNNTFFLDENDSNHIIKVLRHKINDEIVIIYKMKKYLVKIIALKKHVECQILSELENSDNELSCKITLVMALLKEQKFDLVIQKAVELGVFKIVPIQLQQCVSRLEKRKMNQKVLRWQNIAKAAAKQANRNIIPVIRDVIFDLKALTEYKSSCNLVAYEKAAATNWVTKINNNLSSITLIIGPEGGITTTEIAQLTQLGFSNISLGKLILRAETAPLFLLSIINYETNLKNMVLK